MKHSAFFWEDDGEDIELDIERDDETGDVEDEDVD